MSHAFVSYSRLDKSFVRKLYTALQQAGREPWVDWSDIPPTADWFEEILRAIEATDAFVCVLSPEWVASTNCQRELAHALENKRRIIPILYRNVSPDDVAPEVAKANWILFRDEDSFDDGLKSLEFALDTDLAYWILSARLLTRATQWENRKRDRNMTLRGKELAEAERWVVDSSHVQPTPTALQLEFIHASRRAATRRLRTLTSSLVSAATIFLVLAIISVALFRNANIQTQIATQQRNTAIARQLAVESTNQLNAQHLAVALLLANEANQISPSVATRDALLDALTDSPHIDGLYSAPPNQIINGVVVSPDGDRMYGWGSGIFVWNLESSSHIGKQLVAGAALDKTSRPSVTIALSHRGDLIAALGSDDTLSILQAQTGAILHQTPPSDDPSSHQNLGIAFSADDTQVLLLNATTPDNLTPIGAVEIDTYDIQTGTTSKQPIGIPGMVATEMQAAILSPDGKFVAIAGCAVTRCQRDETLVWSVAQRRIVATLAIPDGGVNALAFSPDDTWLVAGTCTRDPLTFAFRCNHGVIEAWQVSAQKLAESTTVTNTLGEVEYLAFTPNGKYLIANLGYGACGGNNCNQGQSQMWIFDGLQQVDEPFAGHANLMIEMSMFPNGRYVAAAGGVAGVAGVSVWKLPAYDAITSYIITPDPQYEVADGPLTYSPDGKSVAMRNVHNVYRWSVRSGAQLASVTTQGTGPVGISADGSLAAECASNVLVWDVSSGHVIQQLRNPEETTPCTSVAFSHDGKRIVATYADYNPSRLSIVEWDRASGTVLQRIIVPATLSVDIQLSADGSLIAGLLDHSSIEFWSALTGKQVGPALKVSTPSGDFAFVPGTDHLAIVEANGIIADYDPQTHRYLQPLVSNLTSGVGTLAFSPDGHFLAASGYYAFTVWDLTQQGAIYADFPHTGSHAQSIAFSPDNHYLTWDDADGLILTRSLRQSDWQAAACSLAGRNLTSAEWSTYIQGIPYTKVCPSLPQ